MKKEIYSIVDIQTKRKFKKDDFCVAANNKSEREIERIHFESKQKNIERNKYPIRRNKEIGECAKRVENAKMMPTQVESYDRN